MSKNRGITLIALIVTIIILLILAGVTLNLVAGSDGILTKATKAVDKNNEATIEEETELALIQLKNEYYQERYVDKTTTQAFGEYAEEKMKTGVKTSNGKIMLEETNKVTYQKEGETVIIAIGTFDVKTGTVKMDSQENNPNEERVKKDVSVPKMTANEMEEGEAFSPSEYKWNGREAYEAFDGINSPNSAYNWTQGYFVACSSTNYIGYNFKRKVVITQLAYQRSRDNNCKFTRLKVQASDDKNDWKDMTEWIYPANNLVEEFEYFTIPVEEEHQYWRVYGENEGCNYSGVTELNFIGYEYE